VSAIKILSFILILIIFGIPLGLNLLVLYDDIKRRRRRREELSNLLPVLKGGRVNGGRLEGSYAGLPVEIFFRDYLTNHAFDHSLFHIRARKPLPFELQYKQVSYDRKDSGGLALTSSADIRPGDHQLGETIGQILGIYHEVGTSGEERFLQVVGTIRADSQEEFFLRPENVAVALSSMEAIYRAIYIS
jgi:hypothetical protein